MNVIALDTETHLFGPYCMAPRLVCLQRADDNGAWIYPRAEATREAARALDAAVSGDATVIGHNFAGYDLPVLMQHEPTLIPLIFEALDSDRLLDTVVIEKLLRRAEGTLDEKGARARVSFAALAKQYLDIEADKGEDGWRLRYSELEDIPPDQWPERARAYALDDVRVLLRIYRAQMERAAKLEERLPGVLGTAGAETRALFALSLMAAWGLVTDEDAVDALQADAERKLETLREVLLTEGLARYVGKRRPKLTMDTKRILLRARQRGAASRQAWELRKTQDPALAAVANYQYTSAKVLGTYVPLLRAGVEQPIHCRIDSIMSTGRASTSQPNLQNLPRTAGFRECIVPHPDHVFCAVDLDGAELRSLAQATFCLPVHKLADLFRADPDADPHLDFGARQLLGLDDLEEAARRLAAGDQEIVDARQRAKDSNFGFPGLMGARRFAKISQTKYYKSGEGRVFTVAEAFALRRAYLRQWPEMLIYFKIINEREGVEEGRAAFRTPITGAWRGGCGAADGANNAFQSLTAAGAKKGLYEITKLCYNPAMRSVLFGSRPIVFAHDEVIVETPRRTMSVAAEVVQRTMIDAAQSLHPDVPVTAKAVLMGRWCKKAKQVRDDEGKIVLWQPKAKGQEHARDG